MSAIEASTVKVQTMADDTLRLVLHIEPRHAKAAFELFGSRGTAVALVALKVGQPEPEPEKLKGGELAKLAGRWCDDPHFRAWLGVGSVEEAAEFIRQECGVTSRAELDHMPIAARIFHKNVRGPYQEHLAAIGMTA